MTDLEGRVIVITGAATGQGAAEARACRDAGAIVVATDIDAPAVSALATELTCIGLEHDVADPARWQEIASLVDAEHGRVDGLVNNAGIFSTETLLDGSVETTRRVWDVNQLGVYLGMKHMAPLMPPGSSIVNISSTGGKRGVPAFAYAASKWAVTGMTKSAAHELGPRGIRVNSVHPGPIDTAMLDNALPERRAKLATATPLGRIGAIDDVVGPVLFLLSPASAHMSGAELVVDGGLIA